MSNEPACLPKTPEDVRAFIGLNFGSLEYGQKNEEPHADDTYTVSAHDLLSAFRWFELENSEGQPAATCVACEGEPSPENTPCAVCGTGQSAASAEPVAWVAADTLNFPHPTCISSLAYMSQIDRERGREYVPLTIIDRYAAPSSAQPAVNGYTCTVPDDCETLHWRGQILSMNELASVAQPAVGEEIHVHIEGQDVLTLPLASSGMIAPRFVVHVPAQAQPVSGADGLQARTDALYIALEVCSAELFAQCADQPRAMKYVEQARHALALEQCARVSAGRPAQLQTRPSGNSGELPRLPLNDPAAAYRVLYEYGQSCARAALAQEQGEKNGDQ